VPTEPKSFGIGTQCAEASVEFEDDADVSCGSEVPSGQLPRVRGDG